MKNQKILKFLTLIFTFIILASLVINTSAVAGDSQYMSENIPDSEIDPQNTSKNDQTDQFPDGTNNINDNSGAVDDALNKASDVVDDAKNNVENAITDAGENVKNAVNDAENNGMLGVLIAVIAAIAIIIIIIVMVSKNNRKYNKK